MCIVLLANIKSIFNLGHLADITDNVCNIDSQIK